MMGSQKVTFAASEINSQLHSIYFNRYCKIYEPDIECLMEIMLPQANTFIDVGANWGYFVGKAACVKPGLQLIAFEPTSLSFRDLDSLRSGFSNHADIKAFQIALGEKEEMATIAQPGFESGLASNITVPTETISSAATTEQVNVKTLSQFDLAPDSIIKIDVEGYELNVLHGGIDRIAETKPAIIFEHWHNHPNDLKPFLDFFTEIGYTLLQPKARKMPMHPVTDDARKISMDFSLNEINQLICDRRYNLLAVHPASRFYPPIEHYIQISNLNQKITN